MSQSRPTSPSDHHIERVPASPDDSGPTTAGTGPTGGPGADPTQAPGAESAPLVGAPSQQSRPGPQDDILLATGEPLRAARSRGGRPTPAGGAGGRGRPAAGRQERIRRQPGRRAWVPNQHGVWGMLLFPPLLGILLGGWSWVDSVLLPAWWGAYFAYWAWSQWLRTRSPRRRALLLPPLGVYTAWTAAWGLVALVLAPYLVQWAVPLVPLAAVAGWEVRQGRERSLASGLSTTAIASLFTTITFQLGVGGAGGFLGTGPTAQSVGWPHAWVATALMAAYFCGTVPYVKTMIRERFNMVLLVATTAAHVLVAGASFWLASNGEVSWTVAVVWVALVVRTVVMPLRQWHLARVTHRPMRPKVVGLTELVFCVLVTVSLAL